MLKIRKQTGDTIVEVLLAIAVVSLMLVGAYSSSRQSLNTTIRSRERDEAVKLAQSQLEVLRAALLVPPSSPAQDPATQTSPFCLVAGNPVVVAPAGDPQCTRDSSDNTFGPGSPSVPYTISLTRNIGGDANLYRAEAGWERLGGGVPEQVQLYYRVYRP